jgi:glycosyltransferase involved in cell wall biosynthesis
VRLLFVIDHFGPGGAQRQMVSLALGLHRRGHQVEFFTYFGEDHFATVLDSAAIVVHVREKQRRFSPSPILELRRLLRGRSYDAVLSYMDTPNFYAEMAGLGMVAPPLVVSQRRSFPAGGIPWNTRLLQHLHRLADHIVSNSHHQRERMAREFPWMSGRISTIVNGVDLQTFSPRGDAERRGDSDAVELLAVGRMDENKNASGLIEALRICREEYGITPTVRWAGRHEPTAAGEAHFATLTALIERYGIGSAWQWLGVRDDVPELLRAHGALVHPSLSEGFSNVVGEALASGKPVLAGDIGDHRWLLREGAPGFLFDPARPREIAAAIHKFACLPAVDRAEMERNARRFAEREIGLDAVVDRYVDLFQRLVERSAGKP